MEMTVKQVMESRRPDAEQSRTWLGHWMSGLRIGLDNAEAMAPAADAFDLGAVALAVACTYLDFRRPDLDWRAGHPKLAALTAALEQRDSFKATYPR
jgi:glutathione S-transferase